MDDFAVRLRLVIKESGKQQKELASAMHLSPARFSNYVNGHSEPSLNILTSICQTLCVSADYLLGLSNISNLRRIDDKQFIVQHDPLGDLTPEYRQQAESYLSFLRQQQAAQLAASKEEA